ncbi:MAG: M28 family peptidase, partial [Bacteroidia bacterium]|nr:M28 family peptidase [Bacteroidia bacterium]
FIFFFFVSLPFFSFSQQSINVAKLKTHVRYLSSEKLHGRLTGSQDELTAAYYISKNFKSLGLIPKGNLSSYYYSYKFKQPQFKGDTVGGKLISGINVAAFLDNHCDKTIIISAHFDHLGMFKNEQGLLKAYPGANDNASGVAGLLELARYFTSNKKKEQFNILFVAFSGHEQGHVGAKLFCEQPTIDLNTISFMVDLDMIGAMNAQSQLFVLGLEHFKDMNDLIVNSKTELNIQKEGMINMTRDTEPFLKKNIKCITFSTGINSDHHQLSDELKKLNFEGEKKALDYLLMLISKLEEMPDYKCKQKQ